MNDTELYEYFKSQTDIFNEMPSDEMWNKISVALNEAKQPAVPKAFLPKLFLLLTVILGSATGLIFSDRDTDKDLDPLIEKKAFPTTKDSIRDIQRSSTKVLFHKQIKKPETKSALPGASIVYFKRIKTQNAKPEEPAATAKTKALNGTDNLEIEEYAPEIPKSERAAFGNRIVITSRERLSKAAFDSLVSRTIKANSDASGKLVVVKAPGHKTFSKFIPATAVLKPVGLSLRDSIIFVEHKPISKVVFKKILSGKDEKPDPETIAFISNAEFPGGIGLFYDYIGKNIKMPQTDYIINGDLQIGYIVNIDGTLSDFKIIHDVGYGLGEEAIRAIKECPIKWIPAQQGGKPVATSYTLPIKLTKSR
jgi:hypothetical protein